MELKATLLGKHLAQHPYNRVRLLSAGIEVSGERHHYLIPFNQLIKLRCKRGLVWGELEFELSDEKVVRLHGTEWQETQLFYHHLQQSWQQWSAEMGAISAEILKKQVADIRECEQQDRWLKKSDLMILQQQIQKTFTSLPIPMGRLQEFDSCRDNTHLCQQWLQHGQRYMAQRNHRWTQFSLANHTDFFQHLETFPLNTSQIRAVVNGDDNVLVLAGTGSGKTSVLAARAGWLLYRHAVEPEQILLLASGHNSVEEMNQRLEQRVDKAILQAKTFHTLALHIIKESGRHTSVVSRYEIDTKARQKFLIKNWQRQCSEKKAQAKGWRQWLNNDLQWVLPEGDFWLDESLAERLSIRLDRWLGLIRRHGGTQAEMIESANEDIRELFTKGIRLMAPLLKVWKAVLKQDESMDFYGLIHQAVNLLEKGRFISPWKHILVDEFQDISPQGILLLSALRKQNKQSCLFAVGDDWQATQRASGPEVLLTTAFAENFGEGTHCTLEASYRFNARIGEIADCFVQQGPEQIKKTPNSSHQGDKKAVMILPQIQLEALLDKLSSYVQPEERILLLARYHHLRPQLLQQAATRWPKLNIEFMTIHESKGQQAEYVILTGLASGIDGFPAVTQGSVLEQVLLPQPESFRDAEERRLMYVALTRARHRVWLLEEPQAPSVFIKQLKELGVPSQRKP